ncbi:MAG: hypothetical protein AAF244_05210 [Pseudomonadota bacterium]
MDSDSISFYTHAYLTEHFPGRMGFAVQPLETRDIDPTKVNTYCVFRRNGELFCLMVVIPDDIDEYNSFKPHHETYKKVPLVYVRPDGTRIDVQYYGVLRNTDQKFDLDALDTGQSSDIAIPGVG